jgi:hypothetical protein
VTEEKTERDPTKPKYKVTTLQEQGPKLPLGMTDGGGVRADLIEVKRWNMREERALGRLRASNPDLNMAQYAGMVLGHMCPKLGPHTFDESMKAEVKTVHIGQMPAGDIFYAYVWLRMKALGNVLDLRPKCGSCNNEFDFPADLNTLEIHVAETPEDALWEYELKEPFKAHGKEVKSLTMGPAIWNSYEMMNNDSGLNVGETKLEVIKGSIQKVNGGPNIIIGKNDLDDMGKFDLENLTELIDKHFLGPNMSVEGKCTKCRRDFKKTIPWSYDDFFGVSSR